MTEAETKATERPMDEKYYVQGNDVWIRDPDRTVFLSQICAAAKRTDAEKVAALLNLGEKCQREHDFNLEAALTTLAKLQERMAADTEPAPKDAPDQDAAARTEEREACALAVEGVKNQRFVGGDAYRAGRDRAVALGAAAIRRRGE